MKTLDTLVSDIYEHLDKLSEGTPLPISESDIDKTLVGIKDALMSWSAPALRNKNFTVRMSNIGKPAKQLWYEKRDSNSRTVTASTQIKFLYGHLLEEIVLMLVRMTDHKVTDEQKEVNLNGILGHMDCKINGEVVDVKTASNFAFRKFSQGSLSEDDPFGYLSQLAAYEEAEGTNNGGFLVLNKESGELCLYQPDDLEKPNASSKIKSLLTALEKEEPPGFCYSPVPDGKKGNMKLAKGCTWCKYKFECFKDSNEGSGLKSYKYANGVVHFTKIESKPNVPEIL